MNEGCRHLNDLKGQSEAENGRDNTFLQRYGRICGRVVFPVTFQDKRRAAEIKKCLSCRDRKDSLVLACADCTFFACLRHKHLKRHQETQKHYFAIHLNTGHVYCFHCSDFIYDQGIEARRLVAENNFRRHMGFSLKNSWNPAQDEVERLTLHSRKRGGLSRIDSNVHFGLRGLVNLGNTCFMNCILQALVHTPLLRDYFCSDQHRCHKSQESLCLMCEMGQVFQSFYSGDKTPYVPYRMLFFVWTHARRLAGYEQQDAHEFLIVLLNELHRQSRSSHTVMAKGKPECQCIIDRCFTGKLQSDVVCQTCKSTSTTIDPYWDISLDLGTTAAAAPTLTTSYSVANFDRRKKAKMPKTQSFSQCLDDATDETSRESAPTPFAINDPLDENSNFSLPGDLLYAKTEEDGDGVQGSNCVGWSNNEIVGERGPTYTTSMTGLRAASSLRECLERFIHPENLGISGKIKCNKCQIKQESTKQLTLKKLPIVACFHLKRFSHTIQMGRKIDSFITFPQYLDMTPYTARHHWERRDEPETEASIPEDSQNTQSTGRLLERMRNKYVLFAVVNHHGKMDSGHYTCYIRHGRSKDWFRCEDHRVTRASLEEVLRSEGYLLFYHKQFLDYE